MEGFFLFRWAVLRFELMLFVNNMPVFCLTFACGVYDLGIERQDLEDKSG